MIPSGHDFGLAEWINSCFTSDECPGKYKRQSQCLSFVFEYPHINILKTPSRLVIRMSKCYIILVFNIRFKCPNIARRQRLAFRTDQNIWSCHIRFQNSPEFDYKPWKVAVYIISFFCKSFKGKWKVAHFNFAIQPAHGNEFPKNYLTHYKENCKTKQFPVCEQSWCFWKQFSI